VTSTGTRTSTKRKRYGRRCSKQRVADIAYNLPEFEEHFPKVIEFRIRDGFQPDGTHYLIIEPIGSMENDSRWYKHEKVAYLYKIADWIHTFGYVTWVNFKMRKI